MTTLSASEPRMEGEAPCALILFVAGDEPNSCAAKQNLEEICGRDPHGPCEVKIVDVLEDFDAASKHGILLTPTLLRIRPEPIVTLLGNLRDRDKVRTVLGIGQ